MTTSAAPQVVHARAPGKINVFLKVGSLLDDGYHDVATAYQAVSLYEDVRAYPADDFSVSVHRHVDTSSLATDGSNLAIKAATPARAQDRLPAAACGSRSRSTFRSPAAWAAGRRMPQPPCSPATRSGAPTCLARSCSSWPAARRRRAVRVQRAAPPSAPGRGDELSPALAKGVFQWVLAFADFGMTTPEVYRELDRHRERHAQDIFPGRGAAAGRHLRAAGAARGRPAHARRGAAQRPAGARAAPRAGARRRSSNWARRTARSPASSRVPGPTVAFLAADLDHALELQIALSAARLTVVRATGPVHGARIVGD